MVIEINKDIERYKESVVMGLTAKQLIYSVFSIVAGGGIVLLLNPYLGLTMSVYVAVPVVTPELLHIHSVLIQGKGSKGGQFRRLQLSKTQNK